MMAENKDLTDSLSMAHNEISKLRNHIEDCLSRQAEFDRRLIEVEKESAETKAYTEDLEDYILNLDSSTRKRNLVISVMSDDRNESIAILLIRVCNFLQQYVETLEFADLDCAYCLGKFSNSSTRPVLCKFIKEKTRNDCYTLRMNLNDDDNMKKIYLNDDLPQLMNERRKTFRTIVKLAKEKKIPASAELNKITVNNKLMYSQRNLDCLPAGLTLEDARVVKVKGGYAFHSAYAWPSNFYPSPIEVEGRQFPTVEHAFQYMKAIHNKEPHTAVMISRAKNPQEAKKLGHGVDSSKEWDWDKIDVMSLIRAKPNKKP